jgi:hypothetical protein
MKLVVALVAVVAALLGGAREARGSCVAAVVVDGWVLFGTYADEIELPPTTGRITAVDPACNDAGQNEPDGKTTVTRIEGVPANVAVVRGDTLYVVDGSLTAMRSHPLHIPSGRAPRRGCGRARAVTGVVDRAGGDSLNLLAEGRDQLVLVHARTRLTNRPAYQPLHVGQRVEVTLRRCRSRVFADRIALTGPEVVPDRYRQATVEPLEAPSVVGWAAGGVLVLALVVLLVGRLTRPR